MAVAMSADGPPVLPPSEQCDINAATLASLESAREYDFQESYEAESVRVTVEHSLASPAFSAESQRRLQPTSPLSAEHISPLDRRPISFSPQEMEECALQNIWSMWVQESVDNSLAAGIAASVAQVDVTPSGINPPPSPRHDPVMVETVTLEAVTALPSDAAHRFSRPGRGTNPLRDK